MLCSLARWCLGNLIWLPTAFHLWCAERELRRTPDEPISGNYCQARRRNLDLLHRYRRRGEFPRNTYVRDHAVPCFVDADGRQCAVAFMMYQTGAAAEVGRLTATVNLARLGGMHGPGMMAWVDESGLSRTELSRIQPSYPPSLGELESFLRVGLLFIVAAAFAVTSITFNLGRLALAYRPRRATVAAGVLSGVLLVGFSLFASAGLTPRSRLSNQFAFIRNIAFCLGAVGIGSARVAASSASRSVGRTVPN